VIRRNNIRLISLKMASMDAKMHWRGKQYAIVYII
jgi:hypothetical protein